MKKQVLVECALLCADSIDLCMMYSAESFHCEQTQGSSDAVRDYVQEEREHNVPEASSLPLTLLKIPVNINKRRESF